MTNFKQTCKVVGFDLDQTLYPKSPEIDSAIQSYIYSKISEHRKCSLEEAGRAFRDLYQEGRGLGGGAALEALGIPDAKNVIQEALERAPFAQFLKPDTTTLKLLARVKKNFDDVDLVTGSNASNATEKLLKLNIPIKLFSHILTADDGSKSDGSIYTKWLSRYSDLAPEQFLYIGDRPFSDYEIPSKMGIKTILVYVKAPDSNINCLQLSSFKELAHYLL